MWRQCLLANNGHSLAQPDLFSSQVTLTFCNTALEKSSEPLLLDCPLVLTPCWRPPEETPREGRWSVVFIDSNLVAYFRGAQNRKSF